MPKPPQAQRIDKAYVLLALQLNDMVMQENGHVALLSASTWNECPRQVLQAWCHLQGIYGIPTIEIVEWLKEQIAGRSAIEIGAGAGDLAHHLGIPATDSRIQQEPRVSEEYLAAMQVPVNYHSDVEKLEASAAVTKYQPQVVIASWVTQWFDPEKDEVGTAQAFVHGVNELEILAAPSVETYIMIGNMNVHGRKRARRKKHEVLKPYGLVSRAIEPQKNCIFLWNTADFR